MSPTLCRRQFRKMKAYHYKKIIFSLAFIIIYSMMTIAAPFDEKGIDNHDGPGGNLTAEVKTPVNRISDKIADNLPVNPHPENPDVDTHPDLELPSKLLKDPDKNIDKKDFDTASKAIRSSINLINAQIKNYTDYKDLVNKKIARFTKDESSANISDENKTIVKALIKTIPQEAKKEKSVTAEDSIGTLVKNEEYYKALDKLNSTLLDKQNQLADIESTITIWQQIDTLLGN